MMHEPDCLTIKGFELVAPNKFKVMTECSGKCFDQNYPKRIAHNFRASDKYVYRFDDGEYFFMKKMKQIYTNQEVDREKMRKAKRNKTGAESVSDAEKFVEKLNEEFTGYEL